jgi:SMC interacting uncharacterized protein involved in chromosome segregation
MLGSLLREMVQEEIEEADDLTNENQEVKKMEDSKKIDDEKIEKVFNTTEGEKVEKSMKDKTADDLTSVIAKLQEKIDQMEKSHTALISENDDLKKSFGKFLESPEPAKSILAQGAPDYLAKFEGMDQKQIAIELLKQNWLVQC